jgi:hypothetical protein
MKCRVAFFVLGIHEFIHHRSVPSKYTHSAPKMGGPFKLSPEHKMATIFSKTAVMIWIIF